MKRIFCPFIVPFVRYEPHTGVFFSLVFLHLIRLINLTGVIEHLDILLPNTAGLYFVLVMKYRQKFLLKKKEQNA